MAHELEMINGQGSMFYVGETPWHRLGNRFIEPPTTEEALEAASLNWEVGLRPLFNEAGRKSTHQEIFRADTNVALGVVGPRYHPLQNRQAFGFFNPLVEDGTLSYETAGVLQEGRRVWILAKVKGDPIEIVRDDIVDRYVLLSNSHDGTLAIRVGFTPIRVVCANTLAMSMEHSDSKLLRIRHTARAESVLETVRDVMIASEGAFQATADQYRFLTRHQVNAADIRKFVVKIFSSVDEKEMKRDPVALAPILNLFESGMGNDLPKVKGTAWAMYQAATEYMQYQSGRSDEGRLNSLWFGPNATRNRLALKEAVDMVSGKVA